MFQETGMMEPPTLKGIQSTYAKACSFIQDAIKCLSDMEILFPNQLEWESILKSPKLCILQPHMSLNPF